MFAKKKKKYLFEKLKITVSSLFKVENIKRWRIFCKCDTNAANIGKFFIGETKILLI